MDFILYHKEIPVLLFDEDDKHNVTVVKEVFDTERLPVHLYLNGHPDKTNKYALCEKLERFLDSRLIPTNRKNFKELLFKLGIKNNSELADKCFHLSLSDPYWVCERNNNKIHWKNINFFENKYTSLEGLELFHEDTIQTISSALKSTFSPDNTTSGLLPKKWVTQNGKSYLIKGGSGSEMQEPVNEVLASEVCKRLSIKHIPYTFMNDNENYYSVCPDMCDVNTELVPMDAVYTDLHLTEKGYYDYNSLINRCRKMNILNAENDTLKIFVLDYIIANEDRHSYNFGFLRDTNTQKWEGVAPVYDSGNSMFLNKADFEIKMINSFHIKAKPFAENQAKQIRLLPLEKIKRQFDFSKLNGIEKWYEDFLAPLRKIHSDKKKALVNKLSERIEETMLEMNKNNIRHRTSYRGRE